MSRIPVLAIDELVLRQGGSKASTRGLAQGSPVPRNTFSPRAAPGSGREACWPCHYNLYCKPRKRRRTSSYPPIQQSSLSRTQALLHTVMVLASEFAYLGTPCRTSRSDWSMDVTLPRLKVVCDYLEKEQKKENAKPRPAAAVKGMPQAMRPTWEE